MTPSHGQRGARQYCCYVTRFKPGADLSSICRLPAGEVDRIVIEAIGAHLKSVTQTDDSTCKIAWQQERVADSKLADTDLSGEYGRTRLAVIAGRMSRKFRAKPISPFRYFNASPKVICLVVMMYDRFPLSLRNVEDLLSERGIDICHETVRLWWNRFGPIFASDIKRQRVSPLQDFRHWR